MLALTFGGIHSVGLDKCKMCIHLHNIIYGIFSLFFKIQRKYYVILLASFPFIAVNGQAGFWASAVGAVKVRKLLCWEKGMKCAFTSDDENSVLWQEDRRQAALFHQEGNLTLTPQRLAGAE